MSYGVLQGNSSFGFLLPKGNRCIVLAVLCSSRAGSSFLVRVLSRSHMDACFGRAPSLLPSQRTETLDYAGCGSTVSDIFSWMCVGRHGMHGAGQECHATGNVWVHNGEGVLLISCPCHPKQLCNCIPLKNRAKLVSKDEGCELLCSNLASLAMGSFFLFALCKFLKVSCKCWAPWSTSLG